MTADFDVIVVGGGPAGAVFAILAARDGRRVALIDPCASAPRSEGLSPRLQAWLLHAGLFDAAAMRAARAPRVSFWDRVPVQANAELIVDRAALDEHLRRMAVAAGVQIVTGSALPLPGHAELANGSVLAAPLVIDARGRRAHRSRPRVQRGPPTIAIGAALRVAPGQGAGSRIVPLDQGWLWLAARGDGTAWVQLTLDAADPAGRMPKARLAEGLEAVGTALPPILAVGPGLLLRDATPVLAGPADALDVIPIGDAASAMDPLSGHGLFWAVSSALAATAVRRTLERQGDAGRDLALRFLRQRHADVYPRQARLGRDFIRSQTARLELPFWSRRAAFPDDQPLNPPEVAARIARRIVVEDGVLAESEVVLTAHAPAGLGWIGGDRAADLFRRSHPDGDATTPV